MLTVASAAVVMAPAAAQAHSLDSSTIAVRVDSDGTSAGVEATISVAVDTLAEAMGSASTEVGTQSWAAEAVTYLDEHTTVTAADGTVWDEAWSAAALEQVEGISSLSVDVVLDTGGQSTSGLAVTYDAVIEALPDHEAVVVLTDADGDISTAGVLDATSSTLAVALDGSSSTTASLLDLVGYGFHHVLAGADHLLFLVALLLTAPLVARSGRWQRRDGLVPTLRDAGAVVTCFTTGHLLTLVAATLGWVRLPSAPVEVLIAVSVGVAAVHAVRPLVRHGERWIAGGFGLVHGLAFATILADLGLAGSTSALDLLAFNVGVELAQLSAVALVLPSLWLIARTRWYASVRVAAATLALVVATSWALDRLGVLANPFDEAEVAVTTHLGWVVAGLAASAVAAVADQSRPASQGRVARSADPGRVPAPR